MILGHGPKSKRLNVLKGLLEVINTGDYFQLWPYARYKVAFCECSLWRLDAMRTNLVAVIY